jgi:hypothetical protein
MEKAKKLLGGPIAVRNGSMVDSKEVTQLLFIFFLSLKRDGGISLSLQSFGSGSASFWEAGARSASLDSHKSQNAGAVVAQNVTSMMSRLRFRVRIEVKSRSLIRTCIET